MNCPKCNEKMDTFVNTSIVEAAECIPCKIVAIVLPYPSETTAVLTEEFIEKVIDSQKSTI